MDEATCEIHGGVRNKTFTLETMSGEEIGGVVNRWRREVEDKIMLQLYRNKMSIGYEEIYCNRLGAVVLFQCRTNTLRLKWR